MREEYVLLVLFNVSMNGRWYYYSNDEDVFNVDDDEEEKKIDDGRTNESRSS